MLGERVQDDARLEAVREDEVPVFAKEETSSQTMPVMWKSGASPKYVPPSGMPSPARWRSALYVMLRCRFVAPLGVPLVPEV